MYGKSLREPNHWWVGSVLNHFKATITAHWPNASILDDSQSFGLRSLSSKKIIDPLTFFLLDSQLINQPLSFQNCYYTVPTKASDVQDTDEVGWGVEGEALVHSGHHVVKKAAVHGFGQRVPGVIGLLHFQWHPVKNKATNHSEAVCSKTRRYGASVWSRRVRSCVWVMSKSLLSVCLWLFHRLHVFESTKIPVMNKWAGLF